MTIANNFQTISLAEMGAVKLMNRIDSKFLLSRSKLAELLCDLEPFYFIQEHENKQIAKYQTLYFDTPNLQMFTDHHNRRLKRQKLRVRRYCDSDLVFCEIKTKKNTGRTKKKRIEIAQDEFENMLENCAADQFINDRLKYANLPLIPHLETSFERITLVDKDKTERITIDFNLHFYNHISQQTFELPNLVIVELKQSGICGSLFKDWANKQRIRSKGFSKYCMGTVLTNPAAKYNRFKPKVRLIEKISNYPQTP